MSSPPARALYVEIEPYCVAWLRNLISRGLIADGDVADFSLTDLRPSDLGRYTQVHFCAGIGLWSAALRRAGVPDSRPVWTASLPCQPFSAAGKGDGFADERHLWPEFFHLVEQCRPEIILGEQVASKDGLTWLDLVQSDLEGTGYTVGSVDSCSAGFGAPHIRQRLYWMAYADDQGQSWRGVCGSGESDSAGNGTARERSSGLCKTGSLALPDHTERRTDATGRDDGNGNDTGWPEGASHAEGRGASCVVGQSDFDRCETRWIAAETLGLRCAVDAASGVRVVADSHDARPQGRIKQPSERPAECAVRSSGMDGGGAGWPGPTNGFWSACDWIFCRDGKWRPVEPGTFPLAHGLPRSMGTGGAELRRLAGVAGLDAKSLARAKEYRIGTLGGYGNAINLEQAIEFCRAALG